MHNSNATKVALEFGLNQRVTYVYFFFDNGITYVSTTYLKSLFIFNYSKIFIKGVI